MFRRFYLSASSRRAFKQSEPFGYSFTAPVSPDT